MNVIIDLLASFGLYQVFIYRKKRLSVMVGGVFFTLITISGFLELMPFLNSKPTNLYARYQSPLISSIRRNTNPRSVFLPGLYSKEIQLAGRKLFLGDYSGQNLRLRKNLRKRIINDIYSSTNLNSFCLLTKKYNIDYVETNSITLTAVKPSSELNINQNNEQISFIDVNKSCR